MEAPTFDYSNLRPQSDSSTSGESGNGGPVRAIESASASTACQTNTSKFAYALTAGFLGLIMLIALAIGMLVISIVSMGISTYGYHDEMIGYHRDEDPYRDMYDLRDLERFFEDDTINL